jgi:hypothetical protein
MAEDWRLKVAFQEEEHGHRLSGFLRDHYPLEHDLAERLRGRVVVSQDGPTLFLYANSRDQAEAAADVVRSFLTENDADAQLELRRWHEVEERWEDPDVPLPQSADDVEGEREKLTETERAESAEDQMDEWEVQVVLPDHRATRELAKKLEEEGLKPLRRWRYLVIPVPSEDDGSELADRIRAEAPPTARVAVEASYAQTVAANPRLSAFSMFGGLGA